MKLAFYEVYGNPEQDEQVTVTRQGASELIMSEDCLLNENLRNSVHCTINDCAFDLSGLSDTGVVLEGVVHPNTRRQRIVRFTTLKARKSKQSNGRIIVLSGHLRRGEAIFDIRQSSHRFDHIANAMVCFTPGTRVLTAFGDMPIEHLRQGDLVHTADNGLQPLRWVGQRYVGATRLHVAPHLKPVKISQDAFGPGLPVRDIWVSPAHRFLINAPDKMTATGRSEVLINALNLVNGSGVTIDETVTEVQYMHLLFDDHQIVFTEGVATESFLPGPNAMLSLEEDARREVLSILPQLESHPLSYSQMDRPTLRPNQAQVVRAA